MSYYVKPTTTTETQWNIIKPKRWKLTCWHWSWQHLSYSHLSYLKNWNLVSHQEELWDVQQEHDVAIFYFLTKSISLLYRTKLLDNNIKCHSANITLWVRVSPIWHRFILPLPQPFWMVKNDFFEVTQIKF